jgi:hypothetical protein
MKADGLDWYASFYKTDGHWTTRTGLWCASKIAELLNENSGFEYDLSLFDESAYEITTYDDFWFGGGTTNQVTLANREKVSYETIIPLYNTDFEISKPSKGYYKKGTYQEAMINKELLEELKEYATYANFLPTSGPYGIITLDNTSLQIITNNSAIDNKNKKILIIQDSFGWYSASFLACDTGEIDLIHTEAFTGSVREYVNQTEPDIVIMMPNQRQIDKIDWSTHTSFFDLR